MDDKQFTNELFKRMYDLGFRKAEIYDGVLFFSYYEGEPFTVSLPRVMVANTCFEKKDQSIDIAGYLDVIDWSKVPVNTPILVRENNNDEWLRRHFADYKGGKVYAWVEGKTSWSTEVDEPVTWEYAKLADAKTENDRIAQPEKSVQALTDEVAKLKARD